MNKYMVMPFLAARIIIGSVLFFNIIINVFYAFCLIFPPQNRQTKLPLTVLLGFPILCTLFYCILLGIDNTYALFNGFVFILSFMIGYTVDYIMVGYVWLNFYYYIQIVPAQCALFHWVKRNIKSAIYVLLGIDILITLLSRITFYVFYTVMYYSSGFNFNATVWEHSVNSYRFSFCMVMMHYFVILCVTAVSSLSTVCYLHKHMKNLGKMGTSISAIRLRNQMRVTITGIFQGVFFFLYVSYALCEGIVTESSGQYLETSIQYVINTFFISGTTVTLGMGQNVYRQRTVDIYKALKCVSICQRKEMAS